MLIGCYLSDQAAEIPKMFVSRQGKLSLWHSKFILHMRSYSVIYYLNFPQDKYAVRKQNTLRMAWKYTNKKDSFNG